MNKLTIASPYLRILAWLVDFAISIFVLLISIWFITSTTDLTTLLNRLLSVIIYSLVINALIWPVINLLLISQLGGTLGKLITGTEIVNPENKHISFKKAILRNIIGYMVSAVLLDMGFIWIPIDKERRAWHDMIADTYVVVKRQSGIITGILSLIIMVFANIFTANLIIQQFNANKEVYQQIIQDVQTEIKSNQEEIKASPMPKNSLDPNLQPPPRFNDVYIN